MKPASFNEIMERIIDQEESCEDRAILICLKHVPKVELAAYLDMLRDMTRITVGKYAKNVTINTVERGLVKIKGE